MRDRHEQARLTLDRRRLAAPATVANCSRNARGTADRAQRWRSARDALWMVIDGLLPPGGRVAVVGAGNTDDLPLTRMASRAATVVLIDLDARAIGTARRREPRALRRRVETLQLDVTGGAADAIVRAAARGRVPEPPLVPEMPLPGSPYDLVIGDLLYSQLLYPALMDVAVAVDMRAAILERYAPILVRGLVNRMQVSTQPGGVLHVHDALAWGTGVEQPFELQDVVRQAVADPRRALHMQRRGVGPHESDPRAAARRLGIPIRHTTMWCWPFGESVEYLVNATVT